MYDIMNQEQSVETAAQDSFTVLGKVWTDLYAKCSEYLNPEQCRTILGYKPVIIPMGNDNPWSLKWYWFLAGGFLLAKIVKR